MKVGLFLQDNRLSIKERDKAFYKTLQMVNENKLDLLVFPEHFYCPDDETINSLNFICYEGEECHQNQIIDIFKKYAQIANCPIVGSKADDGCFIYGLFISPFDDTFKWYGKHIATLNSSFDLGDYDECLEEIFKPIEYKGYKIGMTICYDSNQPIFSKAYGDIDLLINMTGGHVDYKKWSIYQRTRALENKCNYLCTMAYFNENAKNKSYVFGYDGFGKKLPYTIINDKSCKENYLGNGL